MNFTAHKTSNGFTYKGNGIEIATLSESFSLISFLVPENGTDEGPFIIIGFANSQNEANEDIEAFSKEYGLNKGNMFFVADINLCK